MVFARRAFISERVGEEKQEINGIIGDFAREKGWELKESVEREWYPQEVETAITGKPDPFLDEPYNKNKDIFIKANDINEINHICCSNSFITSILKPEDKNPAFDIFTSISEAGEGHEMTEGEKRGDSHFNSHAFDHIGHAFIICRDETLRNGGNEILARFNEEKWKRLRVQYLFARESDVLKDSLCHGVAVKHGLRAMDVSLEKIAEKMGVVGAKEHYSMPGTFQQRYVHFYDSTNCIVADVDISYNSFSYYDGLLPGRELNQQQIDGLIAKGQGRKESIEEAMKVLEKRGWKPDVKIIPALEEFKSYISENISLTVRGSCTVEFAVDFIKNFGFARIEGTEWQGKRIKGLVYPNIHSRKRYEMDEGILPLPNRLLVF